MTEPAPSTALRKPGLLSGIARAWWLIPLVWVVVFVAVVSAVTLYTYTRPQLYRAWARVLIQHEPNSVTVGPDSNLAAPITDSDFLKECEALRSREIAIKLYADFQMANWPAFAGKNADQAADRVRSWIHVRRIPSSSMVDVSILWPDRVLGAKMVNRVIDFYMWNVESRRSRGEPIFATVVTAAEPPAENDVYSPRYALNLALGVFAGLLGGLIAGLIAAALVGHWLARRAQSVQHE